MSIRHILTMCPGWCGALCLSHVDGECAGEADGQPIQPEVRDGGEDLCG